MSVASLPVLVVVSGPMGAGKTTLAHQIARSAGCPAICRDEIKEGMVHTAPGFVAGPGEELTIRTLPVFSGVLELLLRARVTTVAEAAFQDKIWRARLEPLEGIARIRIVHCVVDPEVAFGRSLRPAGRCGCSGRADRPMAPCPGSGCGLVSVGRRSAKKSCRWSADRVSPGCTGS